MKFSRTVLCFGLLPASLLFSGCKDKAEPKVYRVSKAEAESSAPKSSASEGAGMGGMPALGAPMNSGAPTGQPSQVTETAPSNWEAQPLSSMRQASYLVKGDNGATADISLILLSGSAGGVLDNINRWLSQIGKPAVTAEELAKMAQHVTAPLGDVTVVDLEGLPQGGDAAKDGRIIAGIASGEGGTVFFKMRGNSALAESQKEAFVQWIASVRMAEGGPALPIAPVSGPEPVFPAAPGAATAPGASPAPAPEICPVVPGAPAAGAEPGSAACPVVSTAAPGAATAPAAADAKPQIKWEVPENWTKAAPSAMRYASFAVAGQDGESADISASVFGGDGGGDLENVNRWREQIGLEAVGADELKSLIVPVTCQDGQIFMVDMTGPKARILAGWARLDGKSWFFKLIAPDRLAGSEKAAFAKFLQSVQFHP